MWFKEDEVCRMCVAVEIVLFYSVVAPAAETHQPHTKTRYRLNRLTTKFNSVILGQKFSNTSSPPSTKVNQCQWNRVSNTD